MLDLNQKFATRTFITTLTVIGTILLASAVLYFLFSVRAIVLDLVIALVLAAALQPLVAFLRKKKLGRVSAALVSIFATLIVLGGITSLIAAPLISEGVKLISNSPEILDKVTQNTRLSSLNTRFHIVEKISNFRDQAVSSASGNTVPIVTGVVGGITSVIAVIIFVFFILIDGPEAWTRLLEYFPEGQRKRIDGVGHNMMSAISGFVSGNLFISLIAGVFSLVLLFIFKVPYAFALAALVAVLDLIPLVGATIATVIVALVALTKGVIVAIVIAGILLLYQFAENHFIQPLVYSRSVKLSALLVIVVTLAGAELGGITGVLLAIPAAAVIQIAITDLFFRKAAILS